MRPKTICTLLAISGLLFVSMGDRILPKPLSTVSLNTRTTVNNYLIGLFPTKRPTNPNARTDKAVEQLE